MGTTAETKRTRFPRVTLWHAADARPLAFVATYFVLLTVGFATRGWLQIPLAMATATFAFFVAVATHNAIHAPVFRERWANRALRLLLTLAYGHPVSGFVPGHNLSHHRFTQTDKDVMRTSRARFRWHLLNLLLFAPSIGGSLVAADLRYALRMRTRRPRWFRQLCVEWIVLAIATAALAAWRWQSLLLFFVFPHAVAAWGIVTMNLLQHDGCLETSKYDHSRNFVGSALNWWTLNNGFHTIHHLKPSLHWSVLPEAHRRLVAPHIHPALEQPSLAVYLLETFVWPGGRVRYDGARVSLHTEPPRMESR